MVAHEGDSYRLIESFVVHLPFVGLAGPCYYRKHTLLVFYLLISLELNNRRQSLPKLEIEDHCNLLYTHVIYALWRSWVKLDLVILTHVSLSSI